jgi:hypothetical protein
VLLLSTFSLNWYGLHKMFHFAREAKYSWIDLFLDKRNFDLWNKDYIKSLSDEFWVPVLSITAPSRWVSERKVNMIVAMAKELWAQVITFSPPHITDKNPAWFSKYLPKVKRDSHISIAIQNMEPKFLFFIIPEYKNATFSDIRRITWDTTLNLLWIDPSSSMDIMKAQKFLWGSIKNIFFSDRYWNKKGMLPWWAWWGVSYLPLESFLMKLKSSWYSSFITLKINPKQLWVWNDDKVSKNLLYVKKYYSKHFINFKN